MGGVSSGLSHGVRQEIFCFRLSTAVIIYCCPLLNLEQEVELRFLGLQMTVILRRKESEGLKKAWSTQ